MHFHRVNSPYPSAETPSNDRFAKQTGARSQILSASVTPDIFANSVHYGESSGNIVIYGLFLVFRRLAVQLQLGVKRGVAGVFDTR